MVDTARFMNWVEKASRDIKSAGVLKENDCGNDMVAFHCQQAVEKLLKAYIIAKSGVIISSHSLIFLCKEATKYDLKFKAHIKDCAFVNQFYIETRYPADEPLIVTDEESDECIAISKDIYNIVSNLLKQKTTL
ncbi:HEPN domain-containing protein [Anaerovirgula multivorans]|uniref:HEPN domain-containing protein n=1 Tax=Anaerovirgula multivorans TaxID=312168 RepID=A0A239EJM2_9FIRM|nr:HEPN domain-containing protein [Anaerovirgula multivorans]SNS44223.1 HEPN domain-containing protein [Anaerovirgula multivorans]